MNDPVSLLLLSLLGSIAALCGAIAFLYIPKFSKALATYSVAFAAGVLITVSLAGLLPEAEHSAGESAFLIVLLAFLAAFLFERLAFCIHHHNDEHQEESSPFLIVFGDTLHNFVDGIAIAAAYFVSPGLGLITAFSTFLHEVPHEIGDFGVLLKIGWTKRKIVLINIVSSLATLLGAFLVFFVKPSQSLIGYLLAVAAGIFLYLGASDFLPHVKREAKDDRKFILVLLAGVTIMLLTFYAIPHNH